MLKSIKPPRLMILSGLTLIALAMWLYEEQIALLSIEIKLMAYGIKESVVSAGEQWEAKAEARGNASKGKSETDGEAPSSER